MQCPCKSKKIYQLCCKPLHEGSVASDPVALMRSRYSAFVLGLGSYLFETELEVLHKGMNLDDFISEIKTQHWVGLEIVDDSENEVEFKAWLLDEGWLLLHHENSLFVEDEGRLKYAKALKIVSERKQIHRNDSCPCGSLKKYKKCNHEKNDQ